MILDQEKPVAAPGDIAMDRTVTLDGDAHGMGMAIARHIPDCYPPIVGQMRGDDTDGGLDAMLAGLDTTHVRQRRNQSDRAMAAHAEVAHIVEEDHARSARRIARSAQ